MNVILTRTRTYLWRLVSQATGAQVMADFATEASARACCRAMGWTIIE